MTESSESRIDTEPSSTAPPRQPNRVGQVAVWVGIVAGVVFIIAVVFFSGFYTASYTTNRYWDQGYRHSQGQQGPGCTMSPGGMMGPGQQSPVSVPPGAPNPHHP
ncbi:hypothetical protein BA059_09290 [Mycolicibacterium sp. (ex Dasyatis americana)]|jgi:hypothetical protein|uniref:Transmembrane protein n=1 Tax=Mycolicibacterium fortuitum subsp. acetamidolyticum TaxID=144550 RepID=A0A100WL55_MYCFO|nr:MULTISPECIES: hypothetical protein [Mycolicibacterium]OFB40527.1 hypothetical protein BA059_09290 [Mycolicibacterium sp. (ex Dasyatis americana)]MCA4725252.1 hypothetical protein [Mycolicibacterium fortuitum]MCV7139824.1 hypothetical protein [Mycolicibacterium fortuitum]MDG5769362.1 hypothetical protein [Mycolicibacterium fortuitum]MDG5785010.1 hypothetical protein [Mycolicibacterium fortuitum]